MAVSSTIDEDTTEWRERTWVSPWMAGWLFAVVILSLSAGAAAVEQSFVEPDNAMRLVQVRDFLNGQAWFDLTQHRLNPPEGTPMHWARWIDAAIAAPIWLLSPLVGQTVAEIAIAFMWPFAWLACFMFLVTRIAGELVGEARLRPRVELAAAIVAALAFPTMDKFTPASFDHHNVELVLILAAIWALMRMDAAPRAGALAGAALGVAMATAAEALPFLGVGAVVSGLLWIAQPERYARGLAWFGAGLAGASVISFFLLVPPATWLSPHCDAMSVSFLGVGLAAAAVAAALGLAPPSIGGVTRLQRLGQAAALGLVAGGLLYVLFPGCARGGYSDLSDEMMTFWMSQISEARPLVQVSSDDIAMFFGISGAAVTGLVFAGLYLRSNPRAATGWIVAAFLAAGVAFVFWQIRGAAFATAFAIPFAAGAIVKAQERYRQSARPGALLTFAGVVVVSAAAAWSVIGQQVQRATTDRAALAAYSEGQADAQSCLSSAALSQLDDAPAGLILNNFVLGSAILQTTHHSVLAAPYHRNQTGTLAAITAFRSRPEAARKIVEQLGVDYVLLCGALPESAFYAKNPVEAGMAPAETLARTLTDGRPPDWLEPVKLNDSPLALFRVVRRVTPKPSDPA